MEGNDAKHNQGFGGGARRGGIAGGFRLRFHSGSHRCPGESDADFIASGAEICYKPSYTPSIEALDARTEALPELVLAEAHESTFVALIDRRCPVLCEPPRLESCQMVTVVEGIEIVKEDGKKTARLDSKEVLDPQCVRANEAVKALADARCKECSQSVVEACLDEAGNVFSDCVMAGDALTEIELAAKLNRKKQALEKLYLRLTAP